MTTTQTERDELAELIDRHTIEDIDDMMGVVACACGDIGDVDLHPQHVAWHLLAAGYRRPRTITTVEELDALAVGSVVYAASHIGPAERFKEGWMGCGSVAAWSSGVLARDGLPATLLHDGGAA